MAEAIKNIGGIIQNSFPVLGMTCAGCAASVESMLKSGKGVADVYVNYTNQTALIKYDEKVTNAHLLQASLQSIGYDIIIEANDPAQLQEEIQKQEYKILRIQTISALILTIPVVIIGMFFMDMDVDLRHQNFAKWISMIFTAPVVFYFGRRFFISAFRKGLYGQMNMDTLVAISTGIAFLFSFFNTVHPQFWISRAGHPHVYYESAAVIITFILLGKLLEERAKQNTSASIKKLIGLQPKSVTILEANQEREILIQQVQVGNIVVVKPGERVPVDGTVIQGASYVEELMISGEPVPVEKKSGDKVFAGTVNQKGHFYFMADKIGPDTILGKIIEQVKRAQGSKAPVQKLTDKIAGIFVPVVLVISAITFSIWMIPGGDNAFTHALLTSIAVLIVACPCALGLATPTAVMVGMGKGAENNILIKDAESLELAHKVNVVVLDKTGTITEGRPLLNDIVWDESRSENSNLKNILYSLEKKSSHPLATAVTVKLETENTKLVELTEFENVIGKGVKGVFDSQEYFVGSQNMMLEEGIEISEKLYSAAENFRANAATVVFFAGDGKALAVISISDKIKENSIKAIQTLAQRNIEVYMLTGDNEQTAAAVAKQVSINKYKASMLPWEKADFIQGLQKEGKVVAMVGDGINDAQALAQADISIAMGRGSDIAIDVAKITLMTSDLNAVPKALTLSKKIVRGIHQNLFWAFVYNIIGIPLAAGILYPVNGFLLNPMIAGATMALSSVSVVTNSLRLRSVKI